MELFPAFEMLAHNCSFWHLVLCVEDAWLDAFYSVMKEGPDYLVDVEWLPILEQSDREWENLCPL